MKHSLLILALLLSATAGADSLKCLDATGKLAYETYAQVGGPCCGRGSSVLTYEGVPLKKTEVIHGMGPNPGSSSDSDPSLGVTEGPRVDLDNTVTDRPRNLVISHVALNLTLSRTNGSPALPGGTKAVEIVSLVCEADSNLFPVP